MALFDTFNVKIAKQDCGHMGALHDATGGEAHMGMFIFETGNKTFCHFDADLKLAYFFQENSGTCTIGTFTFGIFHNPEEIPFESFIDESSLIECGFEPIQSITVSKWDLHDLHFNLSYHTLLASGICGISFVPADLTAIGDHFEFQVDPAKSELRCWNLNGSFTTSDDGIGSDETKYCRQKTYTPDEGVGTEHFNLDVLYRMADEGQASDESPVKLRVFGTDW